MRYDCTEIEFNEKLEREKLEEINRTQASNFYFEYSRFGKPYHLTMYEDCIGLVFYDSDGYLLDETARFRDPNFNNKLGIIRSKCNDYISQ